MIGYVKLGIAALLPVLATALLYLLEKKTSFSKVRYWLRQILFGIVFGALAVLGTEWGIPLNGAQVNCRDAAVLAAGLLFGGPAGIIAGLIGGVERWFAVFWGVGTFTRVACTVSTILAGVYAALLRKFLFENKKPGWLLAMAIGVVVEVFHLTMVFITNMSTPIQALDVVRACSAPMVIANGLSVMISAMVVSLLGREKIEYKPSRVRISQTIQRWLLVTVTFAFAMTTLFLVSLQNRIALTQADISLDMAIEEASADIRDTSDRILLSVAHLIAGEADGADLADLAVRFNVAEINVVDSACYIVASSDPSHLNRFVDAPGFEQLLRGEREYAEEMNPGGRPDLLKYVGVAKEGGFVQVGYDAMQVRGVVDDQIFDITKNRHVGRTGCVLILNDRYAVISGPDEIPELITDYTDTETISAQGQAWLDGISGYDPTFEVQTTTGRALCRFGVAEGYYIVAILPEAEAMQMRNLTLYVNTFMEVLVFAIMFGLIYLLIKRVVVDQIRQINRSLSRITGGDLGVVVDVRTNEEFASLSDDINSTVDTLKKYIDEASARIDQELQFAKDIQSSALPNIFPAFPKRKDFDIYALMDPAKEVGGDFYDFYLTHSDTLNFLVADVSGKGIPAAMFMMRAKTELKSLTEADVPLDDVFTKGSEALCEGNDAGMFVTAWQGSIDLLTGKLTFVNAGHNPPLVKRGNGKFEYLKTRACFVLAGMEGVTYKTQQIDLAPGDVVFLYTDGVTEATNTGNVLYGEERLLNTINSRTFTDMHELCDFIKADVDAFVGDAPQFDDITMVAFRYGEETPAFPTVRYEKATLEDISDVTAFVEGELEKLGCPTQTVFKVNVAVDEIFSNIVRYGYPEGAGPVTVGLIASDAPRSVTLRFTDEGIPYDPLAKEDPDITLAADERTVGGLGIFMVKKTMDEVTYRYEDGKNVLTVRKNFE